MRVVHLTSVHPRSDIRIVDKECVALRRAGHEVWLVVADGKGGDQVNGIELLDVGRAPGGRIGRMALTSLRIFTAASKLAGDIYHIHDPELLPVGVGLRRAGKEVIYDAHEDVPRQIMGKHWIRPALRRPLAWLTENIENMCVRRMSAVVAATPAIERRFAALGRSVATVRNYPRVEELLIDVPWSSRMAEACYLGGITLARGLREIVQACGAAGIPLHLAGYREPGAAETLAKLECWSTVTDHGVLDRQGVRELLARVRVGIVTLLPQPNIRESLPVKMFEYMAAGIPVVASNFPVWREIVEGSDCGICVDPARPDEIAGAIRRVISDDAYGSELGRNGQRAVLKRFNWAAEEQQLLTLYASITGRRIAQSGPARKGI